MDTKESNMPRQRVSTLTTPEVTASVFECYVCRRQEPGPNLPVGWEATEGIFAPDIRCPRHRREGKTLATLGDFVSFKNK